MKPPPKLGILKLCLLLLAFSTSAQAFYSPGAGRFLSRDPIGEDGGTNLYRFAENDPVDRIDELGLDCIVLADRRVSVSPHFHYSVERFRGCCPNVGTEMDYSQWRQRAGNSPAAKVEVLNTPGFTAEIYGLHRNLADPKQPRRRGWQRYRLSVLHGISAVTYNNYAKNIEKFVVVYSGDQIDQKWRKIINLAQTYPLAEQGGIGRALRANELPIRRFPKSVYYAFGNNSNVFARYLVAAASLRRVEVSGSHPPDGVWAPRPDFVDYRNFRNLHVDR